MPVYFFHNGLVFGELDQSFDKFNDRVADAVFESIGFVSEELAEAKIIHALKVFLHHQHYNQQLIIAGLSFPTLWAQSLHQHKKLLRRYIECND